MTEYLRSHATNDSGVFFDFENLDWDQYESHRPPYPPQLFQLLYQHHESHGGKYDIALDLGAGGGVVSNLLLGKFKKVVFSDASAGYVAQAKQRFAKQVEAGRLSAVERKFDSFNPETDFPGGRRVDLITAGCSIHWADRANVMSQLAELVHPGGTFCAFTYGLHPTFPGEDSVMAAMDKCTDKMMDVFEEHGRLPAHAPLASMMAKYDDIATDPSQWHHVRRLHSLPNEHVIHPRVATSASRARPDIESFEILPDDFCTDEIDFDFFPAYYHNLYPTYHAPEILKRELEGLKEAMGGRKLRVQWPFVVLLATRR